MPKWEPRSNVGVYLGNSPTHAGSVAMVLNVQTGHVSCQYHVVFDDTFSTVEYLRKREEPPNWPQLVETSTEFYGFVDSEDSKKYEELNRLSLLEELQCIFDQQETSRLDEASGTNEDDSTFDDEGCNSPRTIAPEGELKGTASNDSTTAEATVVDEEEESPSSEMEIDYFNTNVAGLRRSKRRKKAVNRLTFAMKALGGIASLVVFNGVHSVSSFTSLRKSLLYKPRTAQEAGVNYFEMASLNEDETFNVIHPTSFIAQNGKNEVYTFREAMAQPDKAEFVEAMVKEIDDFTSKGHWKPVKRSEIGNAKTIKTIWSFKRKRRPDGSLLKHKARLCAHGGMSVYGEHYWETYSPVVNWMSVRTMLIFSEIHKLHTRSIDFTLAFPQAEVKTQLYMEIPLGCGISEEGHVLQILRNIYGLKDAGATWFDHLCEGLINLDFKPSEIDPCIYHKKGLTILIYVDDCLIFSETPEKADKMIEGLKESGYALTDEGELGIETSEGVSSYLGVQIGYDKRTGTFELKQPFLIQRIIEALGDAVKDANVKHTPAEFKKVIHKDENGPERKQNWNYRSLIGMLNYLASSSRPDISYAVHQAARFCADPKLIHEQAVKRIVRYLKGTSDKGIIMKPDHSKGIECFVDASFAGDWIKERGEDPMTVYSRTGYVIFYMGCPITWISKMQSEISLSTTESEYIALSQSLRDVIPFMNIVEELNKLYESGLPKPLIMCKLFEDNNGALALAKEYKYRPRTKHIALKYHHFRSYVNEDKIDILPIDTKDQIADQFTKALDEQTFVLLRGKLMGW